MSNRLYGLYRRFDRRNGCWDHDKNKNKNWNKTRNKYFFEDNILLRTLQYLGGYNRKLYYGDVLRVRNLNTTSRLNILLIFFYRFRLRIISVIRLTNTFVRLFLLYLQLRVTFLTLTGYSGNINFRYLNRFFLFFIIIIFFLLLFRCQKRLLLKLFRFTSAPLIDC